MKYLRQIALILAFMFGVAASGYADETILVNTTWADGTRTNSGPDGSGIDSPWYFTSLNGTLDATPGHMTATMGANSLFFLTYFAPDADPVTLSNPGDTLKITWTFTPNTIGANNTSQNFLFAVVDTPTAALITADNFTTPSAQYYGYAMYCNMGNTLGNSYPYQLRKWAGASADFLSHSGNWVALTNGVSSGSHGYDNGTTYTMVWTLTRNAAGGLIVTNTMTGGTFNGSGHATVSYTDATPAAYTFDTFAVRPANANTTAGTIDSTHFEVEFIPAPSSPTIQTEPQNQTVFEGQNATFNVVVSGTSPFGYQWYYNTDTLLTDDTNSTLTLTNVQLTDAGGYSVVVTNVYGSVTSSVAQLTVNVPVVPLIAVQPQDQPNILPGATATFTVVAYGSQPLNYQWYYNTNTPLTGATSPTLTLTNVQPGDAGSYSVTVSNFAGGVISSNAFLTVNTNPVAPVFILQPVSLTVREEDNAAFTAAAIGTQPITYQWNFNGAPIPDATSNTLSLTGIKLSDAGSYTVIATNSIGSTTSSVAVLTVVPIIPPLPVIPTNQFSITDYGAVGDGVTNNATAIQNAINAASAAGGGTVIVPLGGSSNIYLCGPIALASSVNLQINSGAMLQMLPYGTWPSTSTFITGSRLHDVEISGSGTIDGQGAAWWAAYNANPNIGRPDFINFSHCTNVLIQNVTMQNPPTFHMVLKGNNVNLTIQNITINTPYPSPNTDGMDLASFNVLIQNCNISDGDDNIEIGGSGLATYVTVTNCTFGTGHGVSLGSITSGGVSNLTVINCTYNGTDYGIRMKSDNDRGGLVQNLKYCNLTMTNVEYPIVIYSYYNENGTPYNVSPQSAMNQPSTPVYATTPIWRNIVISNVTATATTGKNIAGIIWGRPEMMVSNLTLCNVTIATPTNTFEIYNAQGIQIIDSPLTAPNTTANTLTLYNAQVTVTNTTPGATLVTLGGLSVPPVNNVLAFYNTMAAITDTGMLGSSPITLGGSSLAFNQNSVAFSNNLSIVSASTLAMTSGNNSFGGAFLGSGPLALSLPSSSSLTLQGDSSGFSGALTVSNGTLLVDNTAGSGTGSGAVTVLGAATLGGSGVIGGPLTVNGTLAPGNSPGTLTVNNDLVINNGAVLQYQLGANSDLTVVSGNLTLGGTLNIINAGGLGAANYTLFTYTGSLSGNATLGATPPGYSYYLNTNTAGQVILAAYSPASTPPGFTAISSLRGNVMLSGGGGSTNGPYYVLTSTNLALPRSQWVRSAFSQFDNNGNFVFTNTPGANTPQRFYMLQLP